MSWKVYQWVWRLNGPLYIGIPPAGALNRCRLYVPARAIWGAVTAEISRSKNEDSFPAYAKIGEDIKENYRFTYMYPAMKLNETYNPWLPKYIDKEGLVWFHKEKKKPDSDRQFRKQILHTRPGTAINPELDSAQEGTLRETECMNPWYKESSNPQNENKPIYLLGYIFIKNPDKIQKVEAIKTMFLGGDTRYGFGKIERVMWKETNQPVFDKRVFLENEDPIIESDILLGHTNFDSAEQNEWFKGRKEQLAGWDRVDSNKLFGLETGTLLWAPGTYLQKESKFVIGEYGIWKSLVTSPKRNNGA